MAKEISGLRNVATSGHGGSGKTSLVEAMLFKAGATKRLGSVDDETSIADHDVEERQRKFTVDSSLLHYTWQGKDVRIIDTPGYPDFVGGMVSSFAAVESTIITVSALKGVELNTRKAWDYAEKNNLARAFVISKMDVDNADFEKTLDQLKEFFGQQCVPFVLPIGEASTLSAVVETLQLPDDIPGEVAERVESSHEVLMEAIIEADEDLMMRYLEGEKISQEELLKTLAPAFASGTVVPVFCTSVSKDIGIEQLLNAIADFFPSPEGAERPASAVRGEEGEQITARASDSEFSAFVFKSMTDPFVGKMNFFRVVSGSATTDSSVLNPRTGKKERLANLYRMQGKEQEVVQAAGPGDILCAAKLEGVDVNDTLCADSRPIKFPEIEFPTPMVSMAVEPKSRGDEQKLSGGLNKVAAEDPTFDVHRDTATRELIVTGMSSLHLDVMLSRLKRRFDVEVTTKEPEIAYKETITAAATAKYRHKKQTGGRGQYGEVYLRLEPRERGEGFEFLDEVVGGSVPNQFIPAVEKGCREILEEGVLAGYRIEDITVALYDGSFHAVDSSEQAFKTATRNAFQLAFADAKPVLLEPIVNLEVSVPSKYMGDITSDLNGRRGRVQDVETIGALQTIRAQAPLSEIANYSSALRSMTAGEGSYTLEFSHYEPVPALIQNQIIAKAQQKREAEKKG